MVEMLSGAEGTLEGATACGERGAGTHARIGEVIPRGVCLGVSRVSAACLCLWVWALGEGAVETWLRER